MNLSSFDEYQTLALRTLKAMDPDMNVVHCAMGMSGEAAELYELAHSNATMTGAIGEIGDCSWYAAVCAHQIGVKFSDIVAQAEGVLAGQSKKESLDPMIVHSGHLLEAAKKYMFYQKPFNYEDVETALVCYVSGLLAMCNVVNNTLEDACFRNINKLRVRFPDQFDSEKAINRDYAAESVAAGTTIV